MISLLDLLTLSLSTHALAFNLALAAAIERNGRATPTITKTIYHTEVRRLPSNYDSYFDRSGSAISNNPAASFVEGVSEDQSQHATSSTLTTYTWPRKPGGEKPTISQRPVNGVPLIFDTRHIDSASSNDDTERDHARDLELNTINKRNTNLYNLRADLAPEGYISVYMSNSTASMFCEEEALNDALKARELHLAVLNATKTVAIPVHGEEAASFCLKFRNADDINSSKSSKATGSSTATASTSKEKMTKASTNEELSESTSSSFKHTSAKVTASETDPDAQSSTMKTRSSHTEETSDIPETSKSVKHASTSTTPPDTDPISPASATDVSSKTRAESSVSEVEEDTSETAESPFPPTKPQSTDTDSSEPETSTLHSTKTKSKTSLAEEPGDASTDPKISPTPKATPLALPTSTMKDSSTDEPFTVSSMNTWYPYISEYLETAEDSTPTAGSAELSSITTTDSVNGAGRLGRRGAPIAAMKVARAERAPELKGGSMAYTSDYSWIGTGTVSTQQLPNSRVASATATASRNAAMKRLKSPFAWWRRDDAGRSTGVFNAGMKSNRLDEVAGQEKTEFFNVAMDDELDEIDEEPTRVSTETSGVEEEEVVATKLAAKQQDDEGNDEDASADEGDKEEEKVQLEEEIAPDEEAKHEEENIGDGDGDGDGDGNEESTSTKSKASSTKPSADEKDGTTPTTDVSADINEESTSTKKKQTDEDEEAKPTSSADDDTPPEDEEPPTENNEDEPSDEAEPNDDPSSTSSKKPKSTKSSTISDADTDQDAEPTIQSTTKSVSTKSKASIPSLESGVSFIFPSAIPQATAPLPLLTGTAPIPTAPITWDPDCPQLSTSTLTAENGLTTTIPMTVGLGCWRTLGGMNGNSTYGSGGSASPHATSAFNILSDPQSRQLGVLCWLIVGFILFCFVTEQYQFLWGEWHFGRGLVWWILGLEMWGLRRRLKGKMEAAERERGKREEAERQAARLVEVTGHVR